MKKPTSPIAIHAEVNGNNEPIYRHIGAKTQQLRTLLDMRQEDLAKKCGLTRTSIANIEAGRQRILLHDVEVIANALHTTPRALLKGMWD